VDGVPAGAHGLHAPGYHDARVAHGDSLEHGHVNVSLQSENPSPYLQSHRIPQKNTVHSKFLTKMEKPALPDVLLVPLSIALTIKCSLGKKLQANMT
jgi:hypothetical protein